MKPILLAAVALFSVAAPPAESGTSPQFSWTQISPGSGGFLGVYLRDVTPEDAVTMGLEKAKGVLVERVGPDSPASAAGIRDGDVVLSYAGIAVYSAIQFQRMVAETPPERSVEVTLWRSGRELNLEVEVGARPQPRWNPGPGKSFSFRMPDLPEQFGHGGPEIFVTPGKDLPSTPRLGVSVTTLTDQMAEFLGIPERSGVLVLEVRSGSPAERAGLKAGDVITTIAGKTVSSPRELSLALSGEEVELEVLRKGQPLRLSVTLESESTSGKDSIRL